MSEFDFKFNLLSRMNMNLCEFYSGLKKDVDISKLSFLFDREIAIWNLPTGQFKEKIEQLEMQWKAAMRRA